MSLVAREKKVSVDGRGRLGYRSWRSPVRWVIGSCALAEAFLDHVLAAAAADQQLVRARADPYAGLVRSRCRERGSSFSDLRRQDLVSRGYLGRCTVSSLLFWTGGVLDLSRVSGGSFSVCAAPRSRPATFSASTRHHNLHLPGACFAQRRKVAFPIGKPTCASKHMNPFFRTMSPATLEVSSKTWRDANACARRKSLPAQASSKPAVSAFFTGEWRRTRNRQSPVRSATMRFGQPHRHGRQARARA